MARVLKNLAAQSHLSIRTEVIALFLSTSRFRPEEIKSLQSASNYLRRLRLNAYTYVTVRAVTFRIEPGTCLSCSNNKGGVSHASQNRV